MSRSTAVLVMFLGTLIGVYGTEQELGVWLDADLGTTYSSSEIISKFNTTLDYAFGWNPMDTDSLSLVDDPDTATHKVLKVFYEAGSSFSYTTNDILCTSSPCKRGVKFYTEPSELLSLSPKPDQVILEYEVYFDSDFSFDKSGKLPGLYSGDKDNCIDDASGVDCFSVRAMWLDDKFAIDAFVSPDQSDGQPLSDWCVGVTECNYISGSEINLKGATSQSNFDTEKWYQIRLEVDTAIPRISLEIDSEKIIERSDIILTPGSIKTDAMLFSSYYNDPYSDDRPSTKAYFKNIKIKGILL